MRRTATLCLTLTLAACGDAEPAPQPPPAAPPPTGPPVAAISQQAAPMAQLPPTLDTTVVPVYYGGEESEDACGGGGDIVSAGTRGGYAQVRSGPGLHFAVIDSLAVGTWLIICHGSPDFSDYGGWTPVVYEPKREGGEDLNCMDSGIAESKPYPGPCPSGWVAAESARVLAG